MTELSIGYLDFETPVEEEEPQKETIHWTDPIDVSRHWCGESRPDSSGWGKSGYAARHPKEVSCVKCLQLYIAKGSEWWWLVHNVYYASTCGPGQHDCQD